MPTSFTTSRSLAGVSGDAGNGTQSFTYDGLNRLTASSGLTTNLGYAYDRDGNRTSVSAGSSTTTSTYDRTGELLSLTDANGTTLYTYDARGNLKQAGVAFNQVTTYAYDLGDRLTSLAGPSSPTATFTFDATGRFATRSIGSVTDTYSYLGASETVAAISTGGVLTASLLDPTGARLANKNTTSGLAAYTLPDLHADVAAAELTGSTTLAYAFRYDGYGQTAAAWPTGTSSGPAQPYRYQGRLDISPDPSQPVYDLGARFYQPSLGVFTQLDSVAGSAQDTLSLNRYLYAEANPATLIDPDGHMAISGTDVPTSYRAYVTVTPSGKRILHTIAPPKHPSKTKVAPQPKPKTGPSGDRRGFSPTLEPLDQGLTALSGFHDFFEALKRLASQAARTLATATNPADLSAAGSTLRRLGPWTRNLEGWEAVGRSMIAAGLVLGYVEGKSEGRSDLDAAARTVVTTGGAIGGGWAAAAMCGAIGGPGAAAICLGGSVALPIVGANVAQFMYDNKETIAKALNTSTIRTMEETSLPAGFGITEWLTGLWVR